MLRASSGISAGFAALVFMAAPSFAAQDAAPCGAVEPSLAAVEKGLAQVERSGKITEDIDFDASLNRYQQELQTCYAGTMQAVQEEAKKAAAAHQSGKDAAARLAAWEKVMNGHRPRVEKAVSRLTTINMKVRDGSVLYTPDLLKKMPKEELDELHQWLTPDAVRKYQALDKTLFTAAVLPAELDQILISELAPPPGCRSCRPRNHTLFDAFADLLAPDAEAVIAGACVPVCSQPEACIPCLIAAGVGEVEITKLMQSELASCDRTRRTRIGRALCKTAVILGYLVTIA